MRYAALLCVLSVGCTGRTEIVVGVVTDLKARGQIDDVKFQALRNGTPVVKHDWTLADLPANDYELPGSFGIYSPDGSAVRVELSVTGWRGPDLIVERTSLLSLVPGQTLFMRMGLVGDCGTLDGPTCSGEESCIEGVCRSKDFDAHRLPSYRKDLVDHVDCQSGTRYIISSTGEPMPTDGTECGADEYCQEGVCLKRLPADPPPSSTQPEWVDTSNPSPAPLRALGGDETSADVYAVGEGGAILHGSGGGDDPAWKPEDSTISTSLFGVFVGGPDEVFACGSGGVVLHRKGGKWILEPIPVVVDRLDAIWGISIDDLWAVGRAPGNLPAILRRTKGVWSSIPSLEGPSGLRAVWGPSADDVWAVGSDSHVQHFDGSKWTRLEVEAGHDFLGVGGGDGGVFLVGRKGLIARATVGEIKFETAPIKSDLFALWGSKALYAVGDYGKILYSSGDGVWTEQISGTEAALFAVYGLRGQIFAAGRLGKILRSDGKTPGPAPDMAVPECVSDGECATHCTGSTLTTRKCESNRCVDGNSAPCAAGLACAADGIACRSACGVDDDCQTNYFCDVNGACKIRILQGTACDDTNCKSAGCRQCNDGLFCTDHVCCNKSPAQCGGCMQCSAPTGTCDPIAAGDDPRGTCTGMTAECTQTKCNGRGSCNNTGNTCGTNLCATGMLTSHACDDGVCKALGAVTCANSSPCADGQSCAGKCADDSGCPAGYYCNGNGDCAAQKNKAGACNVTAYDAANNPTGHCKTAACRECAASQCVDGYCCDSACNGQCQACDLSGKEGTCSQVPSNQPHGKRTKCTTNVTACAGFCSTDPVACTYPGGFCGTDSCTIGALTTHSCVLGACNANSPATSCGPGPGYACSSGTACYNSCNDDSNCLTGYFCRKDGTCQPRVDNGQACNLSTGASGHCRSGSNCHECKSDFCVDGVCCDAACNGQCQACDVTNHVGACYPVSGIVHLTNPNRGACTNIDAGCGGTCAGVVGNPASQTQCSYPVSHCGSDSCPTTTSYLQHFCSQGSCSNNTTTSCNAGYLCTSGSCTGPTCSTDSDCNVAGNYYCSKVTNHCEPSHAAGGGCNVGNECKSGNCHVCTGSNVCAFGVCCANSCTGSCMMCNASGQCVVNPTPGQPVQGRTACNTADNSNCSSCNGSSGSCASASTSTVCGGPSCSQQNQSTTRFCNGSGLCGQPAATLCGPSGYEGRYACEGSGLCMSQCGGDADCASGYLCNTNQKYCGRPNGQDCGQSLDCVSGNCWTKRICCNESCTTGSLGYECVNMDASGVYHNWAKGASCSTGTCTYQPQACSPGAVCVPALGRCDNVPCKCKGQRLPDGRCDSDYCDRANGYLCYEARGVCLNQSPG